MFADAPIKNPPARFPERGLSFMVKPFTVVSLPIFQGVRTMLTIADQGCDLRFF